MTTLLNKGDIILTNPKEGFWGIAVVLTEAEKTDNFDPMCHIAVTPLVFKHRITINEIDVKTLSVLEFERGVRLKPDQEYSRKETSIGIYSRKIKSLVETIGNIDASFIFNGLLSFTHDNRRKINWPLCGNVSQSLGYEAVIAWRRVNDSAAFEAEVIEAERSHDAMMQRFKEEDRIKREKAQLRKAARVEIKNSP
jgi:hypothetical protein